MHSLKETNKRNWHVNIQDKLPSVFIGKVLPIAFLMIITILYSRKLSYEDYGQFQSVWVFANLVCTLIAFGLPTIIFSTPLPKLKQYLVQHKKTILGFYAICWIAAFSFLFYSADNFTLTSRALLASFIIVQTCATVADSLLVKKDQLRVYLLVNFFYSLLFFALHLYFFFFTFNLERLLSGILVLVALKSMSLFLFRDKAKNTAGVPDEDLFLRNWFYTGGNEVLGIIARWLDKLFLIYLLSPKDFAIFFNGAFEIPLFAVLISAMENVMLTNISENLSDRDEATNVFRESFKVLSLVAFPVFFFFLFAHQEAYSIVFDNKYNESIPVFLISIFIIPLRISHYGVILQCYGQASKLALGAAMDIILSLVLMFVLYPIMGTRGIVLALVISTYLQVFYYLATSARILGVNWWNLVPLKYLFRLFSLLGAGYFILSYFLKTHAGPLPYLIIFLLATTLFMAVALYNYFSRNRKHIVVEH